MFAKKYCSFLLYYYFPVVYLFFFFNTIGVPLGIVDGMVKLLIPILLYILTLRTTTNKFSSSVFYVFLLFNLSTVVNYLGNSDFSLFQNDLIQYVIPMLFWPIALSKNISSNKFYDNVLKYGTIALVIGLFLYFSMPSWYQNHLMDLRESQGKEVNYGMSDFEIITLFSRIIGIFHNTYGCVYTAVFILSISVGKLIKGDVSNSKLPLLGLITAVLCILTSGCRGPMLSCFAILGILTIILLRKKTFNLIIFFFFLCVVGYLVADILIFRSKDSLVRLLELSSAIGMREDQWQRVFLHFDSFVFGDGLGAYGHLAFYKTGLAITDNNWIKIFAETGVVGLTFFSFIYIFSLIKGFKDIGRYVTELCVLLSYGIIMIGANPLSFQFFFAIPFWFCVGSIYKKSYNAKNSSYDVYL